VLKQLRALVGPAAAAAVAAAEAEAAGGDDGDDGSAGGGAVIAAGAGAGAGSDDWAAFIAGDADARSPDAWRAALRRHGFTLYTGADAGGGAAGAEGGGRCAALRRALPAVNQDRAAAARSLARYVLRRMLGDGQRGRFAPTVLLMLADKIRPVLDVVLRHLAPPAARLAVTALALHIAGVVAALPKPDPPGAEAARAATALVAVFDEAVECVAPEAPSAALQRREGRRARERTRGSYDAAASEDDEDAVERPDGNTEGGFCVLARGLLPVYGFGDAAADMASIALVSPEVAAAAGQEGCSYVLPHIAWVRRAIVVVACAVRRAVAPAPFTVIKEDCPDVA
jgi:hypothetical protein